ncbi:hypothetical protein AUEXF2481DRAFT_226940 [Aureobasidium subglaciale EXF-2481]|uniref:Uncharacterized protein n=1 Tax=Aureobasidium subglaciale (strain EXF-2481) TaxID=1043005 RepID=A0A074YLD0_AURSE|nr:uncharacterized protein AUEXF2481DRAFT_226940 [Aureobasidium subglaciale EXF-2481]KEQ94927.1 hypothetical protein AUEXF2481DRAFT_226940 [Aureobasidium subglaciale EXF-2481]
MPQRAEIQLWESINKLWIDRTLDGELTELSLWELLWYCQILCLSTPTCTDVARCEKGLYMLILYSCTLPMGNESIKKATAKQNRILDQASLEGDLTRQSLSTQAILSRLQCMHDTIQHRERLLIVIVIFPGLLLPSRSGCALSNCRHFRAFRLIALLFPNFVICIRALFILSSTARFHPSNNILFSTNHHHQCSINLQ